MWCTDEDAYSIAWTTTPWTLPSNVGLTVNPNVTYVKVKYNDEFYYLAENEVMIELDPGMAFGTGTHETTALCLEAKS